MKPVLPILAIAVSLLAGCAHITGARRAPDGSVLAISSTRFLWDSEGVNFTLTDTNGISVGLGVTKSNPDADAIKAIADGVSAGLGRAATQTVLPHP